MITVEVRDSERGTWHQAFAVGDDDKTLAVVRDSNQKINSEAGYKRARIVKPRVGFVPNDFAEIVEV